MLKEQKAEHDHKVDCSLAALRAENALIAMMKRDQDYQSQADDVVTDDEFEKDEVVFAVEAAGPSAGRRSRPSSRRSFRGDGEDAYGGGGGREALAKRKSTEELAAKEKQRLETEAAIASRCTFDARRTTGRSCVNPFVAALVRSRTSPTRTTRVARGYSVAGDSAWSGIGRA